LFAVSTLLCIVGYLALSVPANWFSSLPTLYWTAAELAVTQGSGQPTVDGLRVSAPGAQGTAIVSIQTSFRSAGYAAVRWDTADVPDNVAAALVWRYEYEPGRRFTRALTVEARRLLPITLADDPNWIGRINGLALVVRGNLAQPLLIRGVEAKPMTAVQVLRDRIREWLTFEPWSGESINSRNGGADAQDLPLPFVLAAIVGFALLIYAVIARWWPRSVGPFRPLIAGGIFVVAWFILDVPWQWNLMRQAHATFERYAGMPWHERHLAAEDGALFGFIEKVRAKLPPPPVRVFMAADALYFRDRGAYHLYPYNVYFDPYQNTMPDASKLRAGDYLVVFRRRGVQFDPALKKLRWDGGQPVDAEILLAERGGAVFAIH
jgi:SAM-dependent methyltransferase